MKTSVANVEYFLRYREENMVDEGVDNNSKQLLGDAQVNLDYARAQFRPDCAARAIRTNQDAERHRLSFQVPRA
jgi:hypothetical protein